MVEWVGEAGSLEYENYLKSSEHIRLRMFRDQILLRFTTIAVENDVK